MPPPAPPTPLTDVDAINGFLSERGRELRLDDDQSGALSATETGYVNTAVGVGTGFVADKLAALYSVDDLATSWTAWHWATVAAVRWLFARRGNPIPTSLQMLYEEARQDILNIVAGKTALDLPLRDAMVPGLTNVRMDGRYYHQRLRVQRTISDRVPAKHKQNRDVGSESIPTEFPS